MHSLKCFFHFVVNVFLIFQSFHVHANVFIKYKLVNGKIDNGNIWDKNKEKYPLKVHENTFDSFTIKIDHSSLLDVWLSNKKGLKIVILPLIYNDSIFIDVNEKTISISYLNAGASYRIRENVINGWMHGCSNLPLAKSGDAPALQMANAKQRWQCHYSNIAKASAGLDEEDSASLRFLNLYEAYGLINEEATILRALSLSDKRKRIGNDNFPRLFQVLGGSPLDENILLDNALRSYFHILEKGGFTAADFHRIVKHIDTLWQDSQGKQHCFNLIMKAEWASNELNSAIAAIAGLPAPVRAEKTESKISPYKAGLLLPKGVIRYNDALIFSDGHFANIDSLLTDTTATLKLVDFWASWCYPCRNAYSGTEAFRKQLKDKGVKIIYISTDKLESSWKSANKAEGLERTGVSVKLVSPENAAIVQQLKVFAIPRYLLFDKYGKLIKDNMPGFKDQDLELTIKKYLTTSTANN